MGDEAFSAGSLNATAQSWLTTLLALDITGTYEYGALAVCLNDAVGLELAGEAAAYLIKALLTAFRVTGDLRLLDKADVMMERVAIPLIDKGYFVAGSGLQAHMSHNGLNMLLQQMTYTYAVNAHLHSPAHDDPEGAATYYAGQRDKWATYIDTVYLVDVGMLADNLRHRYVAAMAGMYYHWKRTGTATSWYEAEGAPGGVFDWGFHTLRTWFHAATAADINPDTNQPTEPGLWYEAYGDGERVLFNHECRLPWYASAYFMSYPAAHYFRYVCANIIDFALEGVYPWGTTEVLKYLRTVDYLYEGGIYSVRSRIGSSEAQPDTINADYTPLYMLEWAFPALARFEDRQYLRDLSDAAWAAGPYGRPKIETACWRLVASV